MTSHTKPQIGDDIALRDALEREAATREILQVISRSRDDEQRVFDMILANAARLCGAPMASLNILDEGETNLRMVSHFGMPLEHLVAGETTWPLDSALVPATSAREGRVVQVEDLADTDLYRQGDPVRVGVVDREGIRTFLAVPLVNDHQTFGCIALYRREVKPFAPDQIELVKTFAAQAAIAVENVRQFRELDTRNRELTEALERQTATSEVLNVISRSQSNLQPVLNMIAETAMRLCQAENAAIWRLKDGRFELGAHTSTEPDYVSSFVDNPIPTGQASVAGRAVEERCPVHVDDVQSDPVLRKMNLVERSKVRTMLAVPLFAADGEPNGAISLLQRVIKRSPQSRSHLSRHSPTRPPSQLRTYAYSPNWRTEPRKFRL